MNIIINPGTEPVTNASAENAIENMKHLLVDVASNHNIAIIPRPENDYGDGRYCFLLCDYDNGLFFEIQMPGTTLDKVRFTNREEQNIFEFSRLYIDGSSWIWFIAVDILKRELAKERIED